VKEGDDLSSKQLATSLKAALKQLRSMIDSPSSSQAIKHAKSKYQSLLDLHSSFVSAAAAKQPALAGVTTAGSSGSPFAADISSQLAASAARPNQLQAFKDINSYFKELSAGRPTSAELASAMHATYNAMWKLREGVLLIYNTVSGAPVLSTAQIGLTVCCACTLQTGSA
jgi:hypothetical protein